MSSLSVALTKVRWSLIHRGVLGTLSVAVTRLLPGKPRNQQYTHPFDTQYGVDTSGLISSVLLAAGHHNDLFSTAYYGIPPSRFRQVLQKWQSTPPELPIESYTFIDIGCGKGRAVMLATELPFKEVIGIDLSPDLVQIAASNLEIWNAAGHAKSPARVLRADATEFDLPDTPCLIYLSNPFAEPVVKILIEQIDRSFTAHPRPLDVIYFTPKAGHLFEQHPAYRELWNEPIPMSADDAAVEIVAAVRDFCSAYRRVT
jgi:SAM-dependent methyltransferase